MKPGTHEGGGRGLNRGDGDLPRHGAGRKWRCDLRRSIGDSHPSHRHAREAQDELDLGACRVVGVETAHQATGERRKTSEHHDGPEQRRQ
jgi:hypothetical protein